MDVRRGALSCSIYVADFQTAGRGRHGRTWLSPPGTSLMLSILFRESSAHPVPWRFTSLVALSLCESVEQLLPGLEPSVKWPNDIMLDNAKLAGVLAETSFDGHELIAIVGVGLNVNNSRIDLADLPSATSLKAATGRHADRGELLKAFVRQVDFWSAMPLEDVRHAWAARLWGRGQRLRLLDLGREEDVIVLDVERDGALLVRMNDGSVRRTTTGELLA